MIRGAETKRILWDFSALSKLGGSVVFQVMSEKIAERGKMKTAIMFPGQGAQRPGMMRDIFEEFPDAKKVFGLASETLRRDIYAMTMEGTQKELELTQNTQPCLLACELALWRVFRALGLGYDAAIGFSLGEWAALVAVGTISEADALRLIEKRAKAMQGAVPEGQGGMAVILGQDGAAVRELCRTIEGIFPSNYNCPGNITVSGTANGIERLLRTEGVSSSRVAVSVPSHCVLMRPAVEELRLDIQSVPLKRPEKTLVMNAVGRPVDDPVKIRGALLNQLVSPVLFQQSVEYLLDEGYDTFLELGPGKTLSGMVKRTAKKAGMQANIKQCNSVGELEEIRLLLSRD